MLFELTTVRLFSVSSTSLSQRLFGSSVFEFVNKTKQKYTSFRNSVPNFAIR